MMRAMTVKWLAAPLLSLVLLANPLGAESKGCIKGAAVGAVAGHVAGHHALIGAVAGCAVGHHLAKKKLRPHREQKSAAPARQTP